MAECLFCQVRDGRIPAEIVHSDDDCVAFRDLRPQAPLHVLVVPRRHLPTVNDLGEGDDALVGRLVRVAAGIAARAGHAATGYRLVLNCNRDAGQSVFHIHLHLLAGRLLTWPPG